MDLLAVLGAIVFSCFASSRITAVIYWQRGHDHAVAAYQRHFAEERPRAILRRVK